MHMSQSVGGRRAEALRGPVGQELSASAEGPAPQEQLERLAGAAAWRRAGQRALEQGSLEEAHQAALQGLVELGEGYAAPGVEDDTELKLLAAEELWAAGRSREAADLELRMLGERLTLAERRLGAVLR
jgi:hypothetical protein